MNRRRRGSPFSIGAVQSLRVHLQRSAHQKTWLVAPCAIAAFQLVVEFPASQIAASSAPWGAMTDCPLETPWNSSVIGNSTILKQINSDKKIATWSSTCSDC